MPGEGVSLGAATGRITIDLTDLKNVRVVAQQVGQDVEKSLGHISSGADTAKKSIGGLSDSLKGVAGAIGISLGVAGVVQFGRFALDANSTATAYGRQTVAARNLAGSQGKLNDLLAAYNKATGGAVDKATALANVTTLMSTGFANNAKDLERFVTITRGISVAMGQSQEKIAETLQLAIANTSPLRLNELGLGIAEVTKRISDLQAKNSGLTHEMAFQQAVMGLAEEKFGALAKSVEAQASGAEKAAKAWRDFTLAFGQATGGAIGGFFSALATNVDSISAKFTGLADDIKRARGEWERFQKDQAGPAKSGGGFSDENGKIGAPRSSNAFANWLQGGNPLGDWLATHQLGEKEGEGLWFNQVRDTRLAPFDPSGPIGSRSGLGQYVPKGKNWQAPTAMEHAGDSAAVKQIHVDWATGIEALNVETHRAIIDEETSFGAARAKTVADYNKAVARDEAAYARTRLRENLDQLDALAAVGRDAARRESGEAADLARSMASTRSDAAEQEATTRKDANKQLAKLDKDFAKSQEQAQADHKLRLMDAAGNLDAIALLDERRNFAKSQKDAADAHDDARKDIQDGLKERLDDEAKGLAKALKQQQEAYDLQIADGRANDALRLQDMKDAFIKQQAREAEDHQTQVTQAAEDEADNLQAMDVAHGLRLNQIRTHAIEEAAALQKAADDAAVAAGVADAATKKRYDDLETAREKAWDRFHQHVMDSLTPGIPATRTSPRGYASGGFVPTTGLAMLHQGEFVMPARAVSAAMSGQGGRSVSIGSVSVTIAGNTNMGKREIKEAVAEALEEFSEAA